MIIEDMCWINGGVFPVKKEPKAESPHTSVKVKPEKVKQEKVKPEPQEVISLDSSIDDEIDIKHERGVKKEREVKSERDKFPIPIPGIPEENKGEIQQIFGIIINYHSHVITTSSLHHHYIITTSSLHHHYYIVTTRHHFVITTSSTRHSYLHHISNRVDQML